MSHVLDRFHNCTGLAKPASLQMENFRLTSSSCRTVESA